MVTNQPSLFGDPPEPYQLARRTDPATSHLAAQSLKALRITETRAAILAVLRANPDGLTDEQIAALYQGPAASPSGLRTRRAELVTIGRVADSGRRARTRANRKTIVWVLA